MVEASLIPGLRAARYGGIPRAGAGVARMVKDQSVAPVINVVGDSTGDQVDEWFELLARWLGAQNTNMAVKVARWSDAAQGYGIPQVLQDANAASLTFTGAHYITTPDTAQNSITGDLAGAVDVALSDWTPAANNPAFITKFGADGQRSWRFYLQQTTGLLLFQWSEAGSVLRLATSTVAPTVTDGGRLRVGFELDVNDGAGSHAVRFYTGAAGENTWTQLGAAVVASGGGVTSVFDSTTQLALGSRTDSGQDTWAGTFYSGHVLSGTLTGGKLVAGYDPGLYSAAGGDQTLIGVTGETWSPVGTPSIAYAPMVLAFNGSASGKAIAYSADATRLALQTPIRPHLLYINYGHNDTGSIFAAYDALATQIRTRWACPLVVVAQNPQKSPQTAAQIKRTAERAADVGSIAAMRGYGLLNAFEALGANTAAYIGTDGLHPSAAGSAVWAAEAQEMYLPWPA